ncbi:MAG: OB-fold nucleic acid binding domain-containing protein [archaeon]
MQVKELKPRQGNVNIELEVEEVGEVREFQKFGNVGRVANATAKDESGSIKVSLWNDDIDKVKAGDKIRITNGWVSEFQGEKQLSAGRLGKLEVIGKGELKETEKVDKIEADVEEETKKRKKKPQKDEVTEEEVEESEMD